MPKTCCATRATTHYVLKDREITKSLVQRAEAAGFSALVLTVDAPTFGRRLNDIRNDFKLPPHLQMANFAGMGEKKTGSNDQVSRVPGVTSGGKLTKVCYSGIRYR